MSRVTEKAQTVVVARARRGGALVVGVIAVGALVLGGLLIGSFALPTFFGETVREEPNAVVLAEIKDLAQLEVATGRFETVVDVERDADYLPDWVKGERTVLVAEGDVAATVDLAGLGEDALEISDDGRSATVHLPAPTLQEVELDREGTRVIARDRGMFDRINDALTSGDPSNDEALYERAEEKLADAAEQSDLTNRGEENATDVLTGLLVDAGFERVTVVFDAPPREPGADA